MSLKRKPTASDEYASLLGAIDRQIRDGEGGPAREALQALANSPPPRLHWAELARACWRAGLPEQGLRLLNPWVRPSTPLEEAASVAEHAEYAACLLKIGCAEEAAVLLKRLPENEYADIILYRAFAHIARWDYASAIPLLKKYQTRDGVSAYQRLVANVNLAAALVFEQKRVPAEYLIQRSISEATRRKATLITGNLLHLAAAHFVMHRQWDKAAKALERAKGSLRDTASLYAFLVRKWEALLIYRREPTSGTADEALARLREEATTRRHWETLRDCDRFEAIDTANEDLFRHICFGTPFEPFRERLAKDFGKHAPTLGASYSWQLGGARGRELALLDGSGLKPGQVPHRLLSTLVSDFYRPWKLPSLFFRVFPGEYFNPEVSPHRIHEAVRRLRQWLVDEKLPLTVEETEGEYKLVASRACALRIPRIELRQSRLAMDVQRLRAAFGEAPFSVAETMKALSLPSTSALRFLAEAREQGLLTRSGRSRATRYQLVDSAGGEMAD